MNNDLIFILGLAGYGIALYSLGYLRGRKLNHTIFTKWFHEEVLKNNSPVFGIDRSATPWWKKHNDTADSLAYALQGAAVGPPLSDQLQAQNLAQMPTKGKPQ